MSVPVTTVTSAPPTSPSLTTAQLASPLATPLTNAPVTLPSLPCVVPGQVTHHRTGPIRRTFRHGVYQWLIDLDSVPEQPWYLRPFASFSAADHLGDPDLSIKANVCRFVARGGSGLGEPARIVMLANARVLGHVFDPLSVFWCLDGNDALLCIVAEVHNTYGERHAYLLLPGRSGLCTTDKALHVSPFYDVSGRYALRFELSRETVASTVVLRRSGAVAFTATFRGRPRPATRLALAGQLIRRPLMPQQVSALIRMHGIWLWLRRLPVRRPPHHQPQEGV